MEHLGYHFHGWGCFLELFDNQPTRKTSDSQLGFNSFAAPICCCSAGGLDQLAGRGFGVKQRTGTVEVLFFWRCFSVAETENVLVQNFGDPQRMMIDFR